ncbi:MAG: hypothetical protein WBL45_06245, partial [Solirubrobacterales bacterium]
MRTKIASIVALAGLLAVLVLGASFAGADPLTGNEVAEPAPAAPAIPQLQAPACVNSIDDDADGLIDLADPDFVSPADLDEAPEAVAAPTEGAGQNPAPEASGGVQQ